MDRREGERTLYRRINKREFQEDSEVYLSRMGRELLTSASIKQVWWREY